MTATERRRQRRAEILHQAEALVLARQTQALALREQAQQVPKATILRRMTNWIKRAWLGAPTASEVVDTVDWTALPTMGSAWDVEDEYGSRYGGSDADRRRLIAYGDYDDMLIGWAPYKRTCDMIADTATASDKDGGRGPELQFEPGTPERVVEVAEQIVRRLRLREVNRERLWNACKAGDQFDEIAVTEDYEFLELQHRPPNTMYRIEDATGHLVNFEQEIGRGSDRVVIPKWKCVHLRPDHIRGNRYGTAVGFAARVPWRVLHMLKELQKIRRVVRAPQRLVFQLDARLYGGSKWNKTVNDLEAEYGMDLVFSSDGSEVDIRRALSAVAANIYVPRTKDGVGDVTALEGDSNLANITDIEFFHREAISALPVPPAYIGYESEVNARATVENERISWARFVRARQDDLAASDLQVIGLQLDLLAMQNPGLFQGAKPGERPFLVGVKYPAPFAQDEQVQAQTKLMLAQTAQTMAMSGFDLGWALKRVYPEMTDEDAAEALAGVPGIVPPPAPSEEQAALLRLQRNAELLRKVDAVMDAVQELRARRGR